VTPTRFDHLGRVGARALLLVLLAMCLLGAAYLATQEAGNPDADSSSSDLDLYKAIVERMREGDSYYGAAHDELVERGYGTRSVFNWRTPAYPGLLSLASSTGVMQAGMLAVALAAGAVTLWVMRRTAGPKGLVGGALVVPLTLLAAALPDSALAAELTAGVLILLSVGLFASGHRIPAVVTGIAALFVRELSGLYILVAMALAVRARRWHELAGWCAGLAAYGGYYLWHRHQVLMTIGPEDRADPDGWLQMGGPDFALRTAQMDGILLILPLALLGVLVPLMVIGLLSWKHEAGALAAATVIGYLAVFCVVGKPVNVYWGSMYTPLLAYGLVFLPSALRAIIRQARAG
jgi:hypothetical protein